MFPEKYEVMTKYSLFIFSILAKFAPKLVDLKKDLVSNGNMFLVFA